jgi:hypothetical protein
MTSRSFFNIAERTTSPSSSLPIEDHINKCPSDVLLLAALLDEDMQLTNVVVSTLAGETRAMEVNDFTELLQYCRENHFPFIVAARRPPKRLCKHRILLQDADRCRVEQLLNLVVILAKHGKPRCDALVCRKLSFEQ